MGKRITFEMPDDTYRRLLIRVVELNEAGRAVQPADVCNRAVQYWLDVTVAPPPLSTFPD